MLIDSRIARPIAILLLAGCLIAADDASKPTEPPHSPRAKAAIEKHRTAAEKLRIEYYTKLIAADEQFVKELDASIKVAASNGADAAEIDRISSAHKAAQAELQRHRDALQAPKYALWEVTWANTTLNIWLKLDGTCVGDNGSHGKWERRGNQFLIHWPGATDQWTVSDDGLSMVGSNGPTRLAGKLLGTNVDGAEAPPK